MTSKPKTAWKQLTIRIPVEVHRALKVRAAEEGRAVACIIESLARQYLNGGKRA
jgi:plasmid stability protein